MRTLRRRTTIVERAATLIAQDLEATVGTQVQWFSNAMHDAPLVAVTFTWRGGPTIGGAHYPVHSLAQFCCGIADSAQTDFETWFHLHWPSCPDHEHSLVPVVARGRALWRCSHPNGRSVPIGRLHKLLSPGTVG